MFVYMLCVAEVPERVCRRRRFRVNGTCGESGGMDGMTVREAASDSSILVKRFAGRLGGSCELSDVEDGRTEADVLVLRPLVRSEQK